MADDPQRRFEQDLQLDRSVSSPGREGLVGTTPGDLYTPSRRPDTMTLPPDGSPPEAQPQWRKDFPIDLPQDQFVARRDFAKFLVLASGSFVVGQAWIAGKEVLRQHAGAPPRRKIADVAQLAVGASHEFTYPAEHDRCILVRLSQDQFVAYSQLCTHLSCAVLPDVEHGVFRCPCHEGLFDLASGRNIAGPPPRPLPRITLSVEDGAVWATGVEERTT